MRLIHCAFYPERPENGESGVQTLRSSPVINTEQIILQLATGETLISALDENGQPLSVEQLLVFPPQSRIAPLTDAERQQHLLRSH